MSRIGGGALLWAALVGGLAPGHSFSAQGSPHREAGYVPPEVCGSCHRKIQETYRLTGMGRSFYRPLPSDIGEDSTGKNIFYHQPSDSYFTMEPRGSEYFQRRYQLDAEGRQINVLEKRVDYVMGSGNHSRAYLNRTARGTLLELPLAWYSEKGGYRAMNPGYDRPDHEGFRRAITYDCMFCHNGYPEIPAGHEQPFAEPVYAGPLPEGIDCQRCHGPGARHVQIAKTAGAAKKEIRGAIVNPAHLSVERQMEVCMQCHLETTSFPLPNTIQRYERGPFSYRPGEPLERFLLTFDHAPGSGREDKFEIVSAAYRLRRSECFLKSRGALTCTTCHNPHDIPRGQEASRHYNAVCERCHAVSLARLTATGAHPQEGSCIGCHMPKRRTDDVVHVAMTDHFIQRRIPARDLLADIPERHETEGKSYRGEVVPYYPSPLPQTPENELYLAVAQVIQGSNLKEGIAQLTGAIGKYAPRRPEYYVQLGEAWRSAGDLNQALPWYEAAVRRDANFVFGLQELGTALRRLGRNGEALQYLSRASTVTPDNPVTWRELGLVFQAQGKPREAVAAFQKAVNLNPDVPEAHNNLGVIWLGMGDRAQAEAEFREAIRIEPGYADAHANLGGLLSDGGNYAEAGGHFEISLRMRPADAGTLYGYALLLGKMRRFDEAQRELEKSVTADPQFADAHELLGDLLMARDQAALALPHYREAVLIRPASDRDHLRLGSALLSGGDRAAAIVELRKAAGGQDAAVREDATRLLRQAELR